MSDPFIGKPLPQVGEIIENPENGMNYKVVSVTLNQFKSELTGEETYEVTLIPVVEWKRID
jgi:hypothetical protein